MERTSTGSDAGVPRPSRDAELHLSLTTQPESARTVRDARGSTGIASASWRERVRSRVGVEELLTFHVGRERFATSLASIEEAVEHPDVYRVPEMPETMLGVFSLRGRLIPVCSPMRALGVELGTPEMTVLLMRAGTRRVGVAVDDVDDVISLDLATVRPAPGTEDSDGVLLGVVRQGNELIAIVDPDAIVATCLSGQVVETE
jgi:purine-binding chemotaxis protein CheW